MPEYVPYLLAAAVLLALVAVVRGVRGQRARQKALAQGLERLGFRPCPDETDHLQETIRQIENNAGYRCRVRGPRRMGRAPVYYYLKTRDRHDEEPVLEEEVLFGLARPTSGGLVLVVKPSSLPAGLATRVLGSMATGAWDSQPDDLTRLELPRELRETNIVGALGPAGSGLHDLVDPGTLSVVQGLGDAGAMIVRFRGAWGSAASGSRQIRFRVEEIVSRIRPLLAREGA